MMILLAMIPAFFWGSTYAVTQYALPDWPPILLGALRALPAGLLLLAIKPIWPKGKQWLQLACLGTINIAIFFCLIFVMALTLPSAISSVGMMSLPVFAMAYHWLVHKRTPSLVQIVSGTLLIIFAWLLFNPTQMTLNPLGLLAMLAAIVSIVIGSDVTKSLAKQMHWWQVLVWQLIMGGLVLTIAATFDGVLHPENYVSALSNLNALNLAGLAWVILLNTALGYGLYVWVLQRMTVVEFTFGGIANPIAGIVFGLVLIGDSYSPSQYLLMLGMIVMSLMPQIVSGIKKSKEKKVAVTTFSSNDQPS
ncbi:DMT family transporter [Vibrio sp. LaRot3]|uniref:DMT family transporter n=1 Tax=Vibrio sp. LaRot3 TaxID=2998829 RepID=UPI0022CE1803|nr:DMT family transporter [Vibrio sp. LaRot3]MDA0148166.1 DMT family transporter [Vibrio sp. LaRot3]